MLKTKSHAQLMCLMKFTLPKLNIKRVISNNYGSRNNSNVFENKLSTDRKQTFTERSQLKYARRLVIKLGSAVITREDNQGLALGRLASIVEQVAECHLEGREVMMVTSGAVAFGSQKLAQELLMSLSMRETLSPKDPTRQEFGMLLEPRAAAAVGQSGLMSLYDAMFAQYGVKIAQVLVTKPDFYNEETRNNLFCTLSELISLNIVPIINTNDAVSPPMFIVDDEVTTGSKKGIAIKDNDSLAAMLAAEVQADLLILMSDVDGIYNKPPWQDGAKLMHTYTSNDRQSIEFGQKSKVGTGGMDSKVKAATWALDRGVSVVICNGMQEKAIKTIIGGRKVGTFFTESTEKFVTPVEVLAENARSGSRKMQALTPEERSKAVNILADLLLTKKESVLKANSLDIAEAQKNGLSKALLSRLSLSETKLQNLSIGLKQIAESSHKKLSPKRTGDDIIGNTKYISLQISQCRKLYATEAYINEQISIFNISRMRYNEPKTKQTVETFSRELTLTSKQSLTHLLRQSNVSVFSAKAMQSTKENKYVHRKEQNVGRVLRRTKLANNLELTQITVPIGVLLVIFESRPDSLPQVAALAMASANGLLLKGGKEAAHSNKALMELVTESLQSVGAENAVSLISTREEISDLLSMNDHVDLIIPRGSSELVRNIQEQSLFIPVLGHAEGVCHVYIDKDADIKKALKITRDAKCDYPAACNAMETLLIHEDLMNDGVFNEICNMLKEEGVNIYSGPKLSRKLTFGPPLAKSLKHEYGSLECCVELVKDVEEAVHHIHTFGSGHTEVIITENGSTADHFLSSVDSACVFHNASSRFADGFRFGLGAEVGISTSRIHARGPVGVEGLLTTKWVLRGQNHAVADFAEGGNEYWLHESLPL